MKSILKVSFQTQFFQNFMIFLDLRVDIKILKTVCCQILRFKNVIPLILSKLMKNTENSDFSTKSVISTLILRGFTTLKSVKNVISHLEPINDL